MARNLSKAKNGPGHNSSGMIDAQRLDGYVDRVARLMKEQKDLAQDIKEVCKEAAERDGFVSKALRQLARERLQDPDELHDALEYMDSLRHALGHLQGTPLGKAAENRAQPSA